MAIQLLAADGATVFKADSTFGALRVNLRPVEVINWNSFGLVSGALTGVAASGAVFAFRNTGANPMLIRQVWIGFATTTAFTAAQALTYGLFKANNYSASDTGGTAYYVAGANKHRNSFTNIVSAPDIRISSTAALSAGTRTVEASAVGTALGTSNGVGTTMQKAQLIDHDAGDYPFYIAQNEGFVINNLIAMGAAGVIQLHVNMEFAEVLSY